jgi:hypothetical protein
MPGHTYQVCRDVHVIKPLTLIPDEQKLLLNLHHTSIALFWLAMALESESEDVSGTCPISLLLCPPYIRLTHTIDTFMAYL